MTKPLDTLRPRGACPTLTAPMPVADGLLARFRPASGLSPDPLAALGEAAQEYGNGRVEVTARGSVQVRGLSVATEQDFRAALDRAGIVAKTRVAVECSPVAGEDPTEIRNPLALARSLEAICAEAIARAPLSPKLSIVVESGGQISLAGNKADIRLTAANRGWLLQVDRFAIRELAEQDVPAAVAEILRQLQAIGPRARGGDLAPSLAASPSADLPRRQNRRDNGAPRFLRVPVPYGQVRGSLLIELARFMSDHGITEARPAPERTLVLMGASDDDAPALAAMGFTASGMSLCSGAEVTARGIIYSADLARALDAASPELARRSLHLHVSTCAKGCAYKGRPGIMLSGDTLSFYDGINQKPFARLDPAAIEAGLVSIAAQINRDLLSGA